MEEFRALSERERYGYALIKGHLAGNLLNDVHPECLKVTVLREPIDRIISHYFFAKRTPVHYLHERIHREGLSLKDYVAQDVSPELHNHYTRHFSGLSGEEVERDPDAAVEKAIECLRRYDLVGFQDSFSAFAYQLRSAVNLRLPFLERKVNVTGGRKSVEEIDDATRGAIEAANALDLRVYENLQVMNQANGRKLSPQNQ